MCMRVYAHCCSLLLLCTAGHARTVLIRFCFLHASQSGISTYLRSLGLTSNVRSVGVHAGMLYLDLGF